MIDDAVAQARQRDLIIVTTSSAWNDPGQRDLVAALRATGKPVLVVALRDAYDIAYLPGIDSYLATYSSRIGGDRVGTPRDHRWESRHTGSFRSTSPIRRTPTK